MSFNNYSQTTTSNLQRYSYQLLKGIDFYNFVNNHIDQFPNVKRKYGFISQFGEESDRPYVIVDGQKISAEYIFNSCYNLRELYNEQPQYHWQLQHFKGWWIKTNEDTFDPREVNLMDFRTPQKGAARFFYVLPVSSREALVEFTLFSDQVLSDQAYDQALLEYINTQLGISSFAIEEVEQGIIPMTDAPIPNMGYPHIISIGTLGGAVKPTTGYAFLRIQHQTSYLAQQLAKNGVPTLPRTNPKRFRFYDTLLLHILQNMGAEASGIFSALFFKNSFESILRFLDEDSNLFEEALIFSSLPKRPFLQSLFEVYINKSRTVSNTTKPIFTIQRHDS